LRSAAEFADWDSGEIRDEIHMISQEKMELMQKGARYRQPSILFATGSLNFKKGLTKHPDVRVGCQQSDKHGDSKSKAGSMNMGDGRTNTMSFEKRSDKVSGSCSETTLTSGR